MSDESQPFDFSQSVLRSGGSIRTFAEIPGKDLAAGLSHNQRRDIAATMTTAEMDNSANAKANARFHAVLSSEYYKGREAFAHALLGNDKLTAEEIISALTAGGSTSAEMNEAAEAAARAEMQAVLSQNRNSNIDPNGGGTGRDGRSSSANIWDQAAASNNPSGRAWDNVIAKMNKEAGK